MPDRVQLSQATFVSLFMVLLTSAGEIRLDGRGHRLFHAG